MSARDSAKLGTHCHLSCPISSLRMASSFLSSTSTGKYDQMKKLNRQCGKSLGPIGLSDAPCRRPMRLLEPSWSVGVMLWWDRLQHGLNLWAPVDRLVLAHGFRDAIRKG